MISFNLKMKLRPLIVSLACLSLLYVMKTNAQNSSYGMLDMSQSTADYSLDMSDMFTSSPEMSSTYMELEASSSSMMTSYKQTAIATMTTSLDQSSNTIMASMSSVADMTTPILPQATVSQTLTKPSPSTGTQASSTQNIDSQTPVLQTQSRYMSPTTPMSRSSMFASTSSSPVASVSPSPTPSSTSSTPVSTAVPTVAPRPTTIPATAKKFTFSFTIKNEVCSSGIRENDKNDPAYKTLETRILTAVKAAYQNDIFFLTANVVGFECGSVIPTVNIIKTQNATGNASAELAAVESPIKSGTFAGYATESFSASAAPTTAAPNLYIILKTELSVRQFCTNMDIFKKSLAAIFVTSNGQSYIKTTQIVVFENLCNDKNSAYNKAAPKWYISTSAADARTPDTEMTTRASKLLQLFIEDGTTWRVGAAFSRRITSAELGGSSRPTDKILTELERVLIGMGVTFAVLLIIILIIVLLSWKRNKKEASEYPAVTIENEAYSGDRQIESNSYSITNSGYANDEHETKVKIDQHEYEYPMAPVHETRTTDKVVYQDLSSDQKPESYTPPPMYQPLSASDEQSIRVQVEPEVQQTPQSVTLVAVPSRIEPRELEIEGLVERKDNDEAMRSEFESLEYNMPNADVYPEATKEKNRLLNVIPRPETRVILSTSSEPNSDYINANFVRDQHQKKHYIIAQSPLNETVEDFWRMIYEQNIHVVVMVTPLVQLGVEKCHQYWPADSAAKYYNDLSVQLRKKELKPDFTITTMTLTVKGDSREVVLLRYMAWPEDNIPENVQSFVKFLLEARRANVDQDEMMLVHCSDGVGISGSFVAIDIGIRSLQETKSVDVRSIVKSIRRDRAGAVQVFGEYKFIYKALHEYAEHVGVDGEAFANETDATSSM